MSQPIYLDYAATTPVDPEVAKAMVACLTPDGNFGNPASRSHLYGWRAEEAVESARRHLADLLGADPREIVWTSGATESNNLAIKGAAQANRERGRHVVTSQIEHKAVLDVCTQLEKQGFDVTYLVPDDLGLISPQQVAQALRDDTILVSLMHVNNEIGVINDIAAVGQLCRERGVLFHVDAAQSAGKLALDTTAMNIDFMSVSAHKMYGPKGAGALFVRRSPEVRLEGQIHGGGHERGLRSGTLATHQIVGLGEAARLSRSKMETEQKRILSLRERFWCGLEVLEGVHMNGAPEPRVAGIVNVSFDDVDGESLLMSLRELAVSSGSACTSASLEPSYVLRAMGISDRRAHAALRFSFGRFTTTAEVDRAIEVVKSAVTQLRRQSLEWQQKQAQKGTAGSAY